MSELPSSKEYKHLGSIGNLQECKKHVGEAKDFISDKYYKKEILGTQIRIRKKRRNESQ